LCFVVSKKVEQKLSSRVSTRRAGVEKGPALSAVEMFSQDCFWQSDHLVLSLAHCFCAESHCFFVQVSARDEAADADEADAGTVCVLAVVDEVAGVCAIAPSSSRRMSAVEGKSGHRSLAAYGLPLTDTGHHSRADCGRIL
jgi:hypothetical protein